MVTLVPPSEPPSTGTTLNTSDCEMYVNCTTSEITIKPSSSRPKATLPSVPAGDTHSMHVEFISRPATNTSPNKQDEVVAEGKYTPLMITGVPPDILPRWGLAVVITTSSMYMKATDPRDKSSSFNDTPTVTWPPTEATGVTHSISKSDTTLPSTSISPNVHCTSAPLFAVANP